ncbi:hypothetical protein [Helicobacter rodentium]|uniref:hypothetical protein n=2 Tax=Helicobacter rodentium TaxID=59617 RepID=UPI0026225E91|nr:hypothetical protein [Helicobacter rodentium]
MVQNMRQISESQMKEAKQFLDKAQESIMTSFYKENQSFIDRVIVAQNNMRNGIANSDDKVILEDKNALRFLEVLVAFGGRELSKITEDKENQLLFSLTNNTSSAEIQKQIFEYQQVGSFSSGKYFFDLVFDTLPLSQQEQVLNALAVVHSYFFQKSLEVGSFKVEWGGKRKWRMGVFEYLFFESTNFQS